MARIISASSVGIIDAQRAFEAARPRIEGRELVGAETHNRHAKCLELLQRQRQIENGLGAGGHDRDIGLGKFRQIGRNVEARRSTPMHAADAAGGKDRDARQRRNPHGGGDRGCARPSRRQSMGKIAHRKLGDARRLLWPASRCSAWSSPTRSLPSDTAMVAGMAPSSRMIASSAKAVSAFCGQAMPCAMIVDFERHDRPLSTNRINDFRRDAEIAVHDAALKCGCASAMRLARRQALRDIVEARNGKRGCGLRQLPRLVERHAP